MSLKNQVEALLFASGRYMEVDELVLLTGAAKASVLEELKRIKEQYASNEDTPLKVVSDEHSYKLTVKEKYLDLVSQINPNTELSKTILETLAIIAWKQPILQSDVINARTTKAYDHIQELENMGFISKEKHGRSFILRTTSKFKDYFDLPENREVKDIFQGIAEQGEEQKKMKDFEDISGLDVYQLDPKTQEKLNELRVKPYFDSSSDHNVFKDTDDRFEHLIHSEHADTASEAEKNSEMEPETHAPKVDQNDVEKREKELLSELTQAVDDALDAQKQKQEESDEAGEESSKND